MAALGREADAVVTSVSGGGLASGLCVGAHVCSQGRTRVFLVEPDGKNLQACLQSGERLWPNPPRFLDTAAESIRIQQLGHINFDVLRRFAQHRVFTVSDEEMRDGCRFVHKCMGEKVELSAGAAVATLLQRDRCLTMLKGCKSIVILLCGGNISDANFSALLNAGTGEQIPFRDGSS